MWNKNLVMLAAMEEDEQRALEEEGMTRYTHEELADDWEFKIIRSWRGGFRDPEVMRSVLEGEEKYGWVMLEKLETRIDALTTRMRELPGRVPLKEWMSENKIVELTRERKNLSKALKMIAYRAEKGLVSMLAPHYERSEEEGRALIREMLKASGDLLPKQELGILTVRFYTLANPRANQALLQICQTLNEATTTFPGTNLRLVFEAPNAS